MARSVTHTHKQIPTVIQTKHQGYLDFSSCTFSPLVFSLLSLSFADTQTRADSPSLPPPSHHPSPPLCITWHRQVGETPLPNWTLTLLPLPGQRSDMCGVHVWVGMSSVCVCACVCVRARAEIRPSRMTQIVDATLKSSGGARRKKNKRREELVGRRRTEAVTWRGVGEGSRAGMVGMVGLGEGGQRQYVSLNWFQLFCERGVVLSSLHAAAADWWLFELRLSVRVHLCVYLFVRVCACPCVRKKKKKKQGEGAWITQRHTSQALYFLP